jgi:hypothetical protein
MGRLARRVDWLRNQFHHFSSVAGNEGIKVAVGERLAAAVDKAPTSVARRSALEAEVRAAQAEVARLERHIAVNEAALSIVQSRESEARTAILEWLWQANAPLSAHPLITVVMPTCHAERLSFLRSSIESVLLQSYGNWELIVVDDGPSPVLSPLPVWWHGDRRVRVLRSEARNGGGARNVALAEARGEVIAYLDDDCRWFPWWLHAVAAAYSADPNLDVAYGIRIVEPDSGEVPEVWAAPHDPLMLHLVNPVDTNVLTHRRALADAVWPTGPTCNDYELAVRLCGHRVRHLPVPSVCYGTNSPHRAWSSGRVEANMPRYEEVKALARSIRPLRVVAVSAVVTDLEAAVDTELAALVAGGVDLALACDELPCSPDHALRGLPSFATVPDAIAQHLPDVVVVHWSGDVPLRVRDFENAHVPWVIRCLSPDGFDSCQFDSEWCAGAFVPPPAVNGALRAEPLELGAGPDWAGALTRCVVNWRFLRQRDSMSIAQRWWQPV